MASILSVVAAQTFEKPDSDTWYRLTTRYNGGDDRVGRCIQYFDAESEHPSLLWSAQPAVSGEAGCGASYRRRTTRTGIKSCARLHRKAM